MSIKGNIGMIPNWDEYFASIFNRGKGVNMGPMGGGSWEWGYGNSCDCSSINIV